MQTDKTLFLELKTNNIMLIICLNELDYFAVSLLKFSQRISTETNFFFLSPATQQNAIVLYLKTLKHHSEKDQQKPQ